MIPDDWLDALSRPLVQKFVRETRTADPFAISLAGHTVEGVDSRLIARQVQSRLKAREKLPEWFEAPGIVFPPPENLEQASSEATARYKSRLIQGKSLADLTGGTGIDTYYLSANFDQSVYVEPQPALCRLAAYNVKELNAGIRVENSTAEDFLNRAEAIDTFYIDPSRRDDHQGRVILPGDCTPDITRLFGHIPDTSNVLIKLSPMLDLTGSLQSISRSVNEIHVVAVNNEVKELLYLYKNTPPEGTSPLIFAINLKKSSEENFSYSLAEEQNAQPVFSECREFIYESNAAIRKAGAFVLAGNRFGLDKLGINTHLYTSSEFVQDFPGRVFEVKWKGRYQPSQIRKIIDSGKANIQARNFPDDVAVIRKKTKLRDGGEIYLFFYRDLEGTPVFAGGVKATP